MKVTHETKDAVMLVFYIFYRMNMMTRRNIKQMLQIMQEDIPEDGIEKYFMNELKKIQPIRRG